MASSGYLVEKISAVQRVGGIRSIGGIGDEFERLATIKKLQELRWQYDKLADMRAHREVLKAYPYDGKSSFAELLAEMQKNHSV